MTDRAQLPPAAILIDHQVADFDVWKAAFDGDEQRRIDHGYLGHHLNRAEGDPNSLSVYLAVGDVDRAKAYATSDELKSKMAPAGVTSAPEIRWMTPVREAIVWDRELPAMLVSHHVEDFDTWLVGYDAADELRRSSGIIGQAANRSLDDPSFVIVYHQAESFDTLRSFLRSDDLRTAMKEAGVVSELEVIFQTAGVGKVY